MNERAKSSTAPIQDFPPDRPHSEPATTVPIWITGLGVALMQVVAGLAGSIFVEVMRARAEPWSSIAGVRSPSSRRHIRARAAGPCCCPGRAALPISAVCPPIDTD